MKTKQNTFELTRIYMGNVLYLYQWVLIKPKDVKASLRIYKHYIYI